MKHIVLLRNYSPTCTWGGSENRLMSYFRQIDFSRYSITIALNNDLFSERLRREGLPVSIRMFPFTMEFHKDFKHFFRMCSFLRSLKPDRIIVVNGSFTSFGLFDFIASYSVTGGDVCALEVLAADPQFLRKGAHPDARLPWWLRFIHFSAMRLRVVFCRKILAASNEVQRRMVLWYRYPRSKITVIHHGVDIARYTPDMSIRRRMRDREGIGENDIVCITTSRLSPEKGLDTVIDAFDRCASENPQCRLYIAGDGRLRESIETHTRTKKSAHRITFPGYSETVVDYLRMSDIFILGSSLEGLSNALLEAMATELVAVSVDTPGSREGIDDGVNGFIVERTEEGLYRGLTAASLLTREKRKQIGNAARTTVQQRFDVRNGIEKALALLELHTT
jgi:glycosyltransferase involved in cell wall biosynthesis